MLLCANSALTATSRILFAFARDDGLPFSKFLSRSNKRFRTPINAIIVVSVVAAAMCAGARALPILTAINTVCLYLAYIIPIALCLFTKDHVAKAEFKSKAVWSMGPLRVPAQLISVVWVAFITVLFLWPTPTNPYALYTFGGFLLLSMVYFLAFVRGKFLGPVSLRKKNVLIGAVVNHS
jgi:amino acid transporter